MATVAVCASIHIFSCYDAANKRVSHTVLPSTGTHTGFTCVIRVVKSDPTHSRNYFIFGVVYLMFGQYRICCVVQVQIDHRSSTLHFGGAQLKNDSMANHLSTVASRLSSALAMIEPTVAEKQFKARQRASAVRARDMSEQENKTALARKVLIERRREENERSVQEAEREVRYNPVHALQNYVCICLSVCL